VAARDAVRATEREARRAGTAREQGLARVVVEGSESGLVHLASRRTPSEALAWAGRVLRRRAGEES
jgi:hypothetical protein